MKLIECQGVVNDIYIHYHHRFVTVKFGEEVKYQMNHEDEVIRFECINQNNNVYITGFSQSVKLSFMNCKINILKVDNILPYLAIDGTSIRYIGANNIYKFEGDNSKVDVMNLSKVDKFSTYKFQSKLLEIYYCEDMKLEYTTIKFLSCRHIHNLNESKSVAIHNPTYTFVFYYHKAYTVSIRFTHKLYIKDSYYHIEHLGEKAVAYILKDLI